MSYFDEPRKGGWIIDHDHLAEKSGEPDESEVGITGPSDISDETLAILGEPYWPNHQHGLPAGVKRFRIYDDDGELYYSGRAYLPEDATDDDEFGPLWDFGTPNAGATELRYFEQGKWVML